MRSRAKRRAAGSVKSSRSGRRCPVESASWSLGWAASTAVRCPGMSISGITRMWWLRARRTMPRTCGFVRWRVGHDLRMRLARDPEALVVGEVQVQLVQLQVRHLADLPPDPARAVVAAPVVDHQPALGVARQVACAARRDAPAVAQHLKHRARAVERPGRRAGLDPQDRPHGQPVPLAAETAVAGPERHHEVAGPRRRPGQHRRPPPRARARGRGRTGGRRPPALPPAVARSCWTRAA